jgi:hypothetical protein
VEDSGGEHPPTGEWILRRIGASGGAKAGQAPRDQGVSQGPRGEALPASGSFEPHGVDRHERSFSQASLHARGARGARLVRWKIEEFHREAKHTVEGDRGPPMPRLAHPRKPRRLRDVGLERLKRLAYRSGGTIYQIKRGVCSVTTWCSSSRTRPSRWFLRKS